MTARLGDPPIRRTDAELLAAVEWGRDDGTFLMLCYVCGGQEPGRQFTHLPAGRIYRGPYPRVGHAPDCPFHANNRSEVK
jgi:hypothetical protein